MRRLVWVAAVACTAVLGACGGSDLVVQAQVQSDEGEVMPLENLEVRALPYDRDAVFDSLREAYATPEPEIPAELSALQDSIAAANTAWANATARWNAGRDSLQQLNDRLAGMSRASGEYVVLFRQVNDLFDEVAEQERRMNQEFQRFTTLQSRYNQTAEEIRRTREQWADAAYADVDKVIEERLRQARRPMHVDTTDANGIVRMNVKPGEWWIHARYDLPFEELYWNVPITVDGEPEPLVLNRETAQVRPKL